MIKKTFLIPLILFLFYSISTLCNSRMLQKQSVYDAVTSLRHYSENQTKSVSICFYDFPQQNRKRFSPKIGEKIGKEITSCDGKKIKKNTSLIELSLKSRTPFTASIKGNSSIYIDQYPIGVAYDYTYVWVGLKWVMIGKKQIGIV